MFNVSTSMVRAGNRIVIKVILISDWLRQIYCIDLAKTVEMQFLALIVLYFAAASVNVI